MTTTANPGLTLYGTEGDDILEGQDGDDTVFAGPGDDVLSGWDGNDWLDGGTGNDQLWGDEGNDTLVGAGSAYYDGGPGRNTVVLNVSRSEVLEYVFELEHWETVIIAGGADTSTIYYPTRLDGTTTLGNQSIRNCDRILLTDGYFVIDASPLVTVQMYFLGGFGRMATIDELSRWVPVVDAMEDQFAGPEEYRPNVLAEAMVAYYAASWTAAEMYDHLTATARRSAEDYWPSREQELQRIDQGLIDIPGMALELIDDLRHPELDGYRSVIYELDYSYFL